MSDAIQVCARCDDVIEPDVVHDCIRGLINHINRQHNYVMSALLDIELLIKKTRTVNKCVTIRKIK